MLVKNEIFEREIEYRFKDRKLLITALTHSSYCREQGDNPKDNNERLEFLGDAFFDAIISDILYHKISDWDEGKLSKIRSIIVCERSLAAIASKMNLGDYLYMGKGEALSGGRKKESILADALEAIIGAIYLDGGYECAKIFVRKNFEQIIEDACSGKIVNDYKTKLQEVLQKKEKNISISYVLDKTEGPEHNKTFYMSLIHNGELLGSGIGKTKKEAEQNAAKEALEGGKI